MFSSRVATVDHDRAVEVENHCMVRDGIESSLKRRLSLDRRI
jgi:hypothetical protein